MPDFTIEDARHVAIQLSTRYAKRDEFNNEIRRAYHMEWQEAPKADWIKPTMSPSAHNSSLGAIRLLTATEPQITVPYNQNDDNAKSSADAIEVACRSMWDGSGRVAQRPVHYEMATSAILFGEIGASVTKTADLVKYAEQAKLRGAINRMRALAHETPYYYKIYDPSKFYPDIDRYGLSRVVVKQRTTWGEVIDTWGKLAEDAMPLLTERNTQITLVDYYDWEKRGVWVEEGAEILWDDHGLDFIPFVAQITDGSFLFDYDRPELQRIPLLYSFLKSGLWYRENLSLTTIYSLVYALGSSPLMKRKTAEKGSPLVIDRSTPGGVVDIGPDEDINPFVEKIVDQNLFTSLDLAQRFGNSSTIQPQALGAPPQGTMPFSSISLLAQAGRLPLVSHKEMMGRAAADLMLMSMRWLKMDGDKSSFYRRDMTSVDIDPSEIPDNLKIRCVIEPDLPQDRLSAANVSLMLVNGKMASRAWVRENLLNMGQTHIMDQDIWTEQRMDVELGRLIERLKAGDQIEFQKMMAEFQQQMQAQQAQAQAQPATVGESPEMQGLPPEIAQQMQAQMQAQQTGQVTDEMAGGAYPPGGQVGPGAPLQAPLPVR